MYIRKIFSRNSILCRKIIVYRPISCSKEVTSKQFSNKSTKPTNDNTLITTPIFYVNSVPHIGHYYTTVLADCLARWQKLQGKHVTFTTGTDEHGLKIQQAAAKNKLEPKIFCDNISSKFRELFDKGGINYSDYVRTTEERHKTAVQAIWNKLYSDGHIYKGTYEGWYSTSDEAFLGEQEVQDLPGTDGRTIKVSKESGHVVEWIKEDNYMFRLSAFSSQILEWLNGKVIYPATPYEERVRTWVESGLNDLSVSRQRERLSWGIPVPGDETQTIYVWLDALTNYLTVCDYPADNHTWDKAYHLVGKDILKFHAVYWPAFLMAAGLKPPTAICCHAHWLNKHEKMSKSLGNVVDPFSVINQCSDDGLRYFLLSRGVPHSDGNFTEENVIRCINAEVVNVFCNILSRCSGKVLNTSQMIPPFSEDEFRKNASVDDIAMWKKLDTLADEVSFYFENFNIDKGVQTVMTQLRSTNKFFDAHEPWKLLNDNANNAWLNTVLHVVLNTIRISGILLQPIIPKICNKVLSRLNIPSDERLWKFASKNNNRTCPLGEDNGSIMQKIRK